MKEYLFMFNYLENELNSNLGLNSINKQTKLKHNNIRLRTNSWIVGLDLNIYTIIYLYLYINLYKYSYTDLILDCLSL